MRGGEKVRIAKHVWRVQLKTKERQSEGKRGDDSCVRLWARERRVSRRRRKTGRDRKEEKTEVRDCDTIQAIFIVRTLEKRERFTKVQIEREITKREITKREKEYKERKEREDRKRVRER